MNATDFTHVPGTRRTSALPSPPRSPFKNIRKGLDEGEDTKLILAKMQETLDDMRSKSVSGRPSIGMGRGKGFVGSSTPSPMKSSNFSLLAPGQTPGKMNIFRRDPGLMANDVVIEETGSQLRRAEADEQNEKHLDEQNARDGSLDDVMEVDNQGDRRQRAAAPPKTPRMDGLRDMFRLPGKGAATPSFKGVRELFRGPEQGKQTMLQTPRMDGVREMFREVRRVDTPEYDGLDTMLAVPEEVGAHHENDDYDIGAEEKEDDNIEAADEGRSNARAQRTATRPKSTRALRGTPTDLSTMADDEATPSDAAGSSGTDRRGGRRAVKSPDGAVVHRTGKGKLVAEFNDGDSVASSNTKSRAGKGRKVVATKAKDVDSEEVVSYVFICELSKNSLF